MHQNPAYTHPQLRLGPLAKALTYLLAVMLAAVAIYELSAAHLALLAFAAVMMLALAHRISTLAPSSGKQLTDAEKYRDGGSFRNTGASSAPTQSRQVVSDGGSFERSQM